MQVENFTLPQAGSNNEFNLQDELEKHEFVVLLFQRDYFCTNCRNQVQEVNEHYEQFQDRETQVVSIIPESLSRAEDWRDKYNLQFPVVADEQKTVSDLFDQPVRFGPLGNIHDLLGRMPLTLIVDREGRVQYRQAGSNPADRPSVEQILQEMDNLKTE